MRSDAHNSGVCNPPAIVLGLSPTGLYAVRELGRAGIQVFGVSDGNSVARGSRFLSEALTVNNPEDCLGWLLRRFEKCHAKPILVPTSDAFVEFIANRHLELSACFEIPDGLQLGLALDFLDKSRFYAICEAHGVAYPKIVVAKPDELASVSDLIDFPCMIKPAKIHTIKHAMAGSKGWIAKDLAQYRDVIRRIPSNAGELLVQEIVPGPESEITLYCAAFDKAGSPREAFTARKLRQYPPGFGSASLVQSHPEPETRELAEDLLGRIGFHGIAAAEFKRDARTGVLKIIEINPRPSLWFSVSSAAGKHVVLAQYEDLTGIPMGLTEREQSNGVRWCYTLKDLYTRIAYARGAASVLPRPDPETVGPASSRTYAVFSGDDPVPAFGELSHLAGRALKRLKRP
ncbi:MAG: putative ATP-grasp enzyme [Halomonas sp. HL-93]|nr:MAG: putative ATP-grasp enzyme [Halomonas sp. HL-93]